MGAGQCLLFLAFPGVYNQSFFPNNNLKGREPSLPFSLLHLIVTEPSEAPWMPSTEQVSVLLLTGQKAGWLQCPYPGLLPGLCLGGCLLGFVHIILAESPVLRPSPTHLPWEHRRERDLHPSGRDGEYKLIWGLHSKTVAMRVSNLSVYALSCFSHNGLCENQRILELEGPF